MLRLAPRILLDLTLILRPFGGALQSSPLRNSTRNGTHGSRPQLLIAPKFAARSSKGFGMRTNRLRAKERIMRQRFAVMWAAWLEIVVGVAFITFPALPCPRCSRRGPRA